MGDTSGLNSLGLRTLLGSSGVMLGEGGSTTGGPHQKRPGSSKAAVEFLVSVSFCPEFAPAVHVHIYFSPLQVLCTLLLEEKFVQVQALQHCGRGS